MKRLIVMVIVLVMLAACGKEDIAAPKTEQPVMEISNIELSFSVEDVEKINCYSGTEGYISKRSVTDSEDIAKFIDNITATTVSCDSEGEALTGGIGDIYRFILKSGEEKTVSINGTACVTENGRCRVIESVSDDIKEVLADLPKIRVSDEEAFEGGMDETAPPKHQLGKMDGVALSAEVVDNKLLITLDNQLWYEDKEYNDALTGYQVTVNAAYLYEHSTALWYHLDYTDPDNCGWGTKVMSYEEVTFETVWSGWSDGLPDGRYYAALDVKVTGVGVSEELCLTTEFGVGIYPEAPMNICWSGVLYVGDVVYSPDAANSEIIVPGELIGVCQWDITDHPVKEEVPEYVDIRATFVPWGEPVYEWEGYDPSFRVCARTQTEGELVGFTRNVVNDEAFLQSLSDEGKTLSDLYGDFSGQVESISIMNDNNLEVGSIEGLQAQAVAESLLNCSYDAAAYEEYMELNEEGAVRYQLLIATDNGHCEELYFFESGIARMTGGFYLPQDTLQQIVDAMDYHGSSIPANSQGRGLVSDSSPLESTVIAQMGKEEYMQYLDSRLEHAYIDTVEGGALYYSPYLRLSDRNLIDPGPASCLQSLMGSILYLDGEGRIVKISRIEGVDNPTFEVTRETAGINGLVKREIIDDGPYTEFRVIGERIYTLDADGNLKADGETLAENVREFEPDFDGVCYTDSEGLWRLYNDGRLMQLAEGGVKGFAFGITKVYYSGDGAVWSVPLKGGDRERVMDADAKELIYVPLYNGSCFVVIEDGTGKLTVKFTMGHEYSFVIADSGIESIGVIGESTLLAAGKEEIYSVDISSYGEKNDLADYWQEEWNDFLQTTRSEVLAKTNTNDIP